MLRTLLAIALLLTGAASAARHGGFVDVTRYGATGNGMTDDTAALKTAITALKPGGEVYFPCGTYLVSSTLTIVKPNVTIAGAAGCATIKGIGRNYRIMQIGTADLSPTTPLTAVADELSIMFSADFAKLGGLAAGDYVLLQEGGKDGSFAPGTISTDTQCDLSACRGEVLQVRSVSGSSARVTTALHQRYDPVANAARIAKLANPTSSVTVHDLSFDGSGTASTALYMAGVVNSVVSNVKAANFAESGLLSYYSFNLAWKNVAVIRAGNGGADAFLLVGQGQPNVNGAAISNLNGNGFGMGLHTVADGTFTNVVVDKAGTTSGRPLKLAAASYNQFNGLKVTNGAGSKDYNGVSLTYYSSHNTFTNCVVTNNSAFAGILGFGNYNQYNKFVNCTVSGNAQWQLGQAASAMGQYNDAFWEISGGTYTGVPGQNVLQINGASTYVHHAEISGSGASGIALGSTAANACVDNNTFSPTLSFDIANRAPNSRFNGNITAGRTDPPLLPAGTCAAAPSAAAVQR